MTEQLELHAAPPRWNHIFDSHAHYDDARFDPDRDALLSSMPQRGVSRILCVAADLDSADKCLALAERYPFVYAAAGVHPHEAKSFAPDQSDRLRAQLAHPKCVALGEIGLDYALDLSPRDLQRAVFSYQLRLAKVLDKPVIIHDREAHADTLALLKDAGCRGVVHCYSGSVEMARELVGMGFLIEKGFQAGGDELRKMGIHVESLAIIDSLDNNQITIRE